MLTASIPPFDNEDVATDAFARGWDSAAYLLGNNRASWRYPEPGNFAPFQTGWTGAYAIAGQTAGSIYGPEPVRITASRRRKVRSVR